MCGAGWLLAAGWSMPSQRFKGFTVFKGLEGIIKGLEGIKRLEGLEGLEGLKGLEGLRAGKRQTWMPVNVWRGWQTANLDAHKKPLMCGLGVAVGCKSGQKKRLVCGAEWLLAARWSLEGFRAGRRQKLLMWLDGCKIGLTVESEEGEVPHLRWSQAPPLPWPRPGSADIHVDTYTLSPCPQVPL